MYQRRQGETEISPVTGCKVIEGYQIIRGWGGGGGGDIHMQ